MDVFEHAEEAAVVALAPARPGARALRQQVGAERCAARRGGGRGGAGGAAAGG